MTGFLLHLPDVIPNFSLLSLSTEVDYFHIKPFLFSHAKIQAHRFWEEQITVLVTIQVPFIKSSDSLLGVCRVA